MKSKVKKITLFNYQGSKPVETEIVQDDDQFKVLTPLQETAYNTLFESNYRILNMPTGSGKSAVMAIMSHDDLNLDPGLRAIFIVPQRDIGKGFVRNRFVRFGAKPSEHIVEIIPQHNFVNGDVDSTVTSVIEWLGQEVHTNYPPSRFAICTHATWVRVTDKLRGSERDDLLNNLAVCIDEAHHVSSGDNDVLGVAEGRNKLGKYLVDAMNRDNVRITLATALFLRGDEDSILPSELVDRFTRYSVPIEDHLQAVGLSIEFNFICCPRYIDAVDLLARDKKRTLIYCAPVNANDTPPKIPFRDEMVKVIRKRHKKSYILDLVEDDKDRNARRRQFEENLAKGKYVDYILAQNIGKEGFDYPALERIIIMKPRESIQEMIQMVGRLLRRHPGKQKVEVDVVIPFNLDMIKDDDEYREKLNDYQKYVMMSLVIGDMLHPVRCSTILPEKKRKKNAIDVSKTNYVTTNVTTNVTLSGLFPNDELRTRLISEATNEAMLWFARNEDKDDHLNSFKRENVGLVSKILDRYRLKADPEIVSELLIKTWFRATFPKGVLSIKDLDPDNTLDLIYRKDGFDGYHPLGFLLFGTDDQRSDSFRKLRDFLQTRIPLTEHPRWNGELELEWDYSKNDALGIYPDKVSAGSNVKAWWICNEAHSWKSVIGNRFALGCGCTKCSGNAKSNTTEFVQKANEMHHNKYDYSKVEYINASTKVEIRCNIHGSFYQRPTSHLRGQGCIKCGGRSKSNTTEFAQKANEMHHNKYDYSKVEYINASTKVEIICPKHGSFYQRPCDHLRGAGCRACGYRQ